MQSGWGKRMSGQSVMLSYSLPSAALHAVSSCRRCAQAHSQVVSKCEVRPLAAGWLVMRPAVLAVRAMHGFMTIEAGAPAAPDEARRALEVYRPCQGARSDVQQQGYSYSGPGVRAVRALHAPGAR